MKKEEIYLDLTKLTKEQLINVAEVAKDEMHTYSYNRLSKGNIDNYKYLLKICYGLVRSNMTGDRIKITYNEFLNLFQDKEHTLNNIYLDIRSTNQDLSHDNYFLTNKGYQSVRPEDKIEVDLEKWNKVVVKELSILLHLEVGKTFELNGYICEVKEKIEEKKWYKITYNSGNTVYKKISKDHFERLLFNYNTIPTEITDYHFINLLEKHSK